MRADGRDYNPDWKVVSKVAADKDLPAEKIMEALLHKEHLFRSLPEIGRRNGLPKDVIDRAFSAHTEIADSIAEMKN